MSVPSTDTGPRRRRVIWYGVTIFVSSAVLLVLEIVAGRLIAPYVGVSLYSWTSIIGVILAGLSIGNWAGGRWADGGGSEMSAGIVLALGGVFCLGSLLALSLVAPWLQNSRLDLISSSFLYVVAMFFVPAVLLGVVAPLLTTLALRLDERAGHIVGRMHALAALGSIVGTFLTGYVLVQYFGTRRIVLGSALCLFALALPYLRRAPRLLPALIALAVMGLGALTYTRQGFTNPCDRESNYYCLRVTDASSQAPFGEARALVLDHLMHGINHRSEPTMLVSPYVHLIDELIHQHYGEQQVQALRYFFAGGGAYTQPRAVKASTPRSQVTVAELDPAVTDLVRAVMYLDTTGMRVIHRDARAALQSLDAEQFDVIVTDVFHDISVPYHLLTLEFARLVRTRLTPPGLYAANVVDAFPDPKLVKSLVRTLQNVFDHVDVWLDAIPNDASRVTYVISASARAPAADVLRARRGFRRQWVRLNEPLFATGTPLAALPLLTDDFVPVERMIGALLLSEQGL